MNLIIRARDVLRGVSPALVDELDAIISRANLVWTKQHDPQTGVHTDISVESIDFLGTTQTTVGAAGSASALPSNPTGYLVVLIDGTERVIPYYAKT